MVRTKPWLRRLVGLALGCASLAGAAGCLHTLPALTKEQKSESHCLPQCCKSKVYIFIHDGCDPLDTANMEGLVEHLQKLGFIKTYYGMCFCYDYFAREIRRLSQEEPEARFVLMGFGRGSRRSHELAAKVAGDNVTIDLLVLLGGGVREKSAADRPANVMRTLNIQGTTHFDLYPKLDNAFNLTYPNVGQHGAPTHADTVDLLLKELLIVASRVPAIVTAPVCDPHPEPTPRPVVPPAGPRDKWDFLKPEQLPAPKEAPQPAPKEAPRPEELPVPKEGQGAPARTTSLPGGATALPTQDFMPKGPELPRP